MCLKITFLPSASNPICSANSISTNKPIELAKIEMVCSVNFSGNWTPVMKWQQEEGSVITAGVVINTVPYKSVTSSLTVSVTRSVTGSTFACTTYFNGDNKPSSTSATNIPDYRYKWNYTINNHDG